MTLLEKLFRPWDIPNEDSSLPNIHIKPVQEKGESKNKSLQELRIQELVDETSTVKLNQSPPVKVTVDTEIKPHHSEVVTMIMNGTESIYSPGFLSTPNYFFDNLSPSDFHELQFGKLGTTATVKSNIFLYPNSINELANLSKGELTSIGLLPFEHSMQKVKRQRLKRFHCPHCEVAFSNNGQLKGHIRIHTGERPYACEAEGCNKSFTRNEELTRHKRIHSGIRPFPCTYCGKKFGRKDHLKKHTRTHQRSLYNSHGVLVGAYGRNPFQPLTFHQPTPPLLQPNTYTSTTNLNTHYATYPMAPPPSITYPF